EDQAQGVFGIAMHLMREAAGLGARALDVLLAQPQHFVEVLGARGDVAENEDHGALLQTGQGRGSGRNCSQAAPSASTPASSKRRPMICKPIGKPVDVYPALMDKAGCSLML